MTLSLVSEWHGDGTAREDERGSGLAAIVPARAMGEARPGRHEPRDRSARVVIAGHASVQNLRRGHYELAVEEPTNRRLAAAFEELILAI
jgi:hypothetical protein